VQRAAPPGGARGGAEDAGAFAAFVESLRPPAGAPWRLRASVLDPTVCVAFFLADEADFAHWREAGERALAGAGGADAHCGRLWTVVDARPRALSGAGAGAGDGGDGGGGDDAAGWELL
jgi:hypothetical protein